MKIAITGHTKGIGQGLYTYFTNLGHTVEGFSRTNGYDLSSISARQKIVSKSTDFDVFINNAYIGQNDLFNELFPVYKDDTSKTIVNIASFLKYREFLPFTDPYKINKNNLYKSMVKHAFLKEKKCRLISINPGYIDTDMVTHISNPKMTVDDAVKIIGWAILQPQHIEIGELSFWITNSL